MTENADGARADDLFRIGIGIGDCRRFAAKFHDAWDDALRRGVEDAPPGYHRSREDDVIDIVMRGEGGSCIVPISAHNVDATFGYTGSFTGFAQHG